MTIETVGIVGAGQMGQGIAQAVTLAGCAVTLVDVDRTRANEGREALARTLRRLGERGKLDPGTAEAALKRVEAAGDTGALAHADLVIEAATEREEIKRGIFASLAPVLRDEAVLATNTSSIPITRLASAARDPRQFVGIHFFNPVPLMRLVEVIPGLATAPETVEVARAFAQRLGKEVVLSRDEPGFVVNRMLLPMINEAVFLLAEGTASAQDIDRGARLGLNHPLGPLQLADLIGLDTCLEIIRVLHASTGDGKYRPAPLLQRYVEAGWLGRKSGRGFYDYGGPEPVPAR
ncbi:3-hydroxybutyryl-CoA dehydrogenase [Erythrobacteraceae bacterium CFH 75059]|uniref:3-hydroxyacyl-CoA dehydrogenase family protein n=1 Tax=Qipengyuania thermophila TaxID=2509361 RepID=UPI00101EF584|nr:3-hydroxyacyl-CoA dehydrogenase NAD-binding domain-containing protein [Qipengyuania thermophila]TCD06772.1 3-hydroxybutyryl-CoA dehydrogenase [Erythrobacteraceae bacterium CFH 75059]